MGKISLFFLCCVITFGQSTPIVPASASVIGTNASNQPVAATSHGISTPLLCADTSSSATTYMCSTTPTFTPASGDLILFTGINQNNSGSSTLNVNGHGNKPIKKQQNASNLAAGDLQAAGQVAMLYDGTNFQMQGQIGNAAGGGITFATPAAGGIAYGVNTSQYGTTTAGTAKQVVVSGGTGTPVLISFPDVVYKQTAQCSNATATRLWNQPTSGGFGNPNCLGVTGNFTIGVTLVTPSGGGADTFEVNIPADWDTSQQPYIAMLYGSRTNTSGTVIWTISTACNGAGDGTGTENPTYNAESAMGTQTMAAASKMWRQSAQLTTVTSGNGCVPGSVLQVKAAVSGSASAAINVYGATITVPRLITVQAN